MIDNNLLLAGRGVGEHVADSALARKSDHRQPEEQQEQQQAELDCAGRRGWPCIPAAPAVSVAAVEPVENPKYLPASAGSEHRAEHSSPY